MSNSNYKIYAGYYEGQTNNPDEPNFILDSISDQFEESLFKAAWYLESNGLISESNAKNMDSNLADELGLHIMGFDTNFIKNLITITHPL